MATITESLTVIASKTKQGNDLQHKEPLKLKGVLDQYEHFDVTPAIGREYPTLNLKDLFEAPNFDELLRDLAITISQRGVVFFRKQDALDNDLQKVLAQRLGELSGKPTTSKLHIHTVSNSGRRLGGSDDEISVISSEEQNELYPDRNLSQAVRQRKAVPGGDTLWASGYELFDRISPAYQKFLEGLTATYAQPIFGESAAKNGFQLYSAERGAPENVGNDLKAIHPVVRTNPVTGWKSIFAAGHHAKRINDVSEAESEALLKWFVQLIVENHDRQVRLKWKHPDDLAIWDNRATYHTATYDLEKGAKRTGQRAVSLAKDLILIHRVPGGDSSRA